MSFQEAKWGCALGTEGSRKKDWGTWKIKLAELIKFIIVGPDQGETQEWERGRSLSPHIPHKAVVAKQMAQHIFKPLFNTVTFFACLLFIPLVKSSTSCHCLKENVRGLSLPVPLLSSVGERVPGTSARCGPGCRTCEAAEGWAPHQNEPTKEVHSQSFPHSSPFQVETYVLPKALSLYFLVSFQTPLWGQYYFHFKGRAMGKPGFQAFKLCDLRKRPFPLWASASPLQNGIDQRSSKVLPTLWL